MIGAGAVVSKSIPANVIAAGNPARVVRELDPDREIRKREDLYADPLALEAEMQQLERYFSRDNSLISWLRALVAPTKHD